MNKCGVPGEVCDTYWQLQDCRTELVEANKVIDELREYVRLANIAHDRGHTDALAYQLACAQELLTR